MEYGMFVAIGVFIGWIIGYFVGYFSALSQVSERLRLVMAKSKPTTRDLYPNDTRNE